MAEMKDLIASMNALIKLNTAALDRLNEQRPIENGLLSEEAKITATRKAQWENVLQALRKGRVKDFIPGNNIKKHVESVEEEIAVQCICYDLKYSDLTDAEKVLLLRLKLPHEVVAELVGCCEQEGTTIDTISYTNFRNMVLKQCGVVTPLVNVVMQYFGPDRLVQGKDTPMVTHNVKFMNNLHVSMQPSTNQERIDFVDLIQRTAYYASIRDPEVQKALSEIPENEATFKKFKETAVLKATQIEMHHKTQAALTSVSADKEVAVCQMEQKKSAFYKNKDNTKKKKFDGVCYWCGKQNHRSPQCYARKNGKPRSFFPEKEVSNATNKKVNVKIVDTVEGDPIDGCFVRVFQTPEQQIEAIHSVVAGKDSGSIMYSTRINNILLELNMDSGAGGSVIPLNFLKKIPNCPTVMPTTVKLRIANGEIVDVEGVVHLMVNKANNPLLQPVKEKFYVYDGPYALMGRTLIAALEPELYRLMKNVAAESRIIEVKQVEKSNNISDSEDALTDQDKLRPCKQLKPPMNPSFSEAQAHCEDIANAHASLFDGKLGCFKGVEAKIHLEEDAQLKVMPAAKVPVGIQSEFNAELKKMYELGESVDGPGIRVASQIVPVVKLKDGVKKVRNCVNYQRTINPFIKDEPYNFPTPNEQIEKLNGEYYTVLDFSGAYQQIKVYEPHRKFLTIVTPWGYLQPERLQFGIKTAPKIFQSNMDQLLAGIPSIACIVDDVCITGKTPKDHFENLEKVLHRIEAAGLKLSRPKCLFYQPEVKYLGRIISKDGISMDPEKVSAITYMPSPSSRQTLQSFLGHMSFVARHVPGLSAVTAKLSELLKKDQPFKWTKEHDRAFQKCKELAGNMATLAHFDENKEIVVTTDASPIGLGAALSHRIKVGNKSYLRPIAYASRTLTQAERNYAQIDREGLAVFWAIRHWRQYLYCRHFTLQTDCSALTRIFGAKNNVSGCAVGRLQRWAMELSEYDFATQHIKGSTNIADNLSRLPQPTTDSLLIPEENFVDIVQCLATLPVADSVSSIPVNQVEEVAALSLEGIPLTAAAIAKATRDDPIYGKVLDAIKSGEWRGLTNEGTEGSFKRVRDSLAVVAGCIMRGNRVVIPAKHQEQLLSELHETHMGAVKMKSLAREYVWWPNINQEIEGIAARCEGCAKHRSKPTLTSLTHWPWATRPMERVHVDFAEYKGVDIFVMVDVYSKFIWAVIMYQNTKTNKLLCVLDSIFADRGLPSVLVSDNGPQFTSSAFKDHMKSRGVKHVLTPPYHPASNGAAERAVGVLKDALYKMDAPAAIPSLQTAITKFLEIYRSSPHTTTNVSPHELMKGYEPRTKFSLLKPSNLQINEKKFHQKVVNRDSSKTLALRTFEEDDTVLVYNTLTKKNDVGKVISKQGRNTYLVQVGEREKLVSADHMVHTQVSSSSEIQHENMDENTTIVSDAEESEIDEDVPHSLSELYIKHNLNGNSSNNINDNNANEDIINSNNSITRKVYVKRNEVDRLSNGQNMIVSDTRTRPSNKHKDFKQYK